MTWADDADALAGEASAVLGGPVERADDLPHATRGTATARVVRVHTSTRSAVVKFISSGDGDGDGDGVGGGVGGGFHDPARLRYWRREPDFYESGVPEPFGQAAVDAPELLGLFERAGGVVLWLEDLEGRSGGRSGGRLGITDLERAGWRLGRAQAPYAMGAVPAEAFPWSEDALLSQLHAWDDVGWDLLHDDKMWRQPLIERHYSPPLRESLVDLGEKRWEILEISGRLPQTICHHDAWLNNIFSFSDRTVLIDWAFVGHGHVGCDAGNIITDACGDLLLPTSLLPQIDAVVTKGYLDGLVDGGWTGDHRTVRLGICLMAAKWSWLTPHQLRRAGLDEHAVYGGAPADSDHLFAERAAMLGYLSTMAAEARRLAAELGV
ncbi:MAG TPA: phosphotransferase [Acidimicrobiales bacterium]